MERLTTDTPQTNMETLANFAYAKDKEVRLTYGDGLEDVALADYIADHAKENFGCTAHREDVLNGDSCWECDCPLAVLNAVATQAAELRSRLKRYEDEDEQGRLIRLPCPMNTKIYLIVTKRARSYSTKQFRFIKTSQLTWCNLETVLRNFGKTVFLDRNEAETAMERMSKEDKDGEHS